jgi:acyl-coenzyme A synthetase/AMP-(fatty) acid ligase
MLLDDRPQDRPILVDAASGRIATPRDILSRANSLEVPRDALAFLLVDGSMDSYVWFLTLVEARVPVALIDGRLDAELLTDLMARYRPELIVDPGQQHRPDADDVRLSGESGPAWLRPSSGIRTHEELAVLLTTSGSTGSPKFVRVSTDNLVINARQIVDSLEITPGDRGVTALPLFYSFGMSVVTSHALAGSSVLVTDKGVLEDAFWSEIDSGEVTILPGVPTTFAMLKKLGFERRELPQLRALIQAGGRLDPELVSFFHDLMAARNGRFSVMYGQTEASPRISCLPRAALPEKLGSAGVAMPGGTLSIVARDGAQLTAGEVGEVVYTGPNVMMGYAEDRAELSLGDTFGSTLRTGDLGYLDDEGFLFLTGRTKRIAKLAGARVSIDELETMAARLLPPDVAVAIVSQSSQDGVTVFVVADDIEIVRSLRRDMAKRLRVPPALVAVRNVTAIPLLPNNKVDYQKLDKLAGAEVDTS